MPCEGVWYNEVWVASVTCARSFDCARDFLFDGARMGTNQGRMNEGQRRRSGGKNRYSEKKGQRAEGRRMGGSRESGIVK